MNSYNEKEVIKQLSVAETQKDAFRQIVEFYSQRLYWQIRRMVICHDDANDVLQNTFIKAWTSIDYFRGEAKMSTWLYRIAINESLNFLEKERSRNNLPIDSVPNLEQLRADEYFDGDEAEIILQKAIASLPEKQRIVFNLRYYDELSYEEISNVMGTSVGALKASYHHAVKKIEKFIG